MLCQFTQRTSFLNHFVLLGARNTVRAKFHLPTFSHHRSTINLPISWDFWEWFPVQTVVSTENRHVEQKSRAVEVLTLQIRTLYLCHVSWCLISHMYSLP